LTVPPLTTETGTQVVENGVEPPYSYVNVKAPWVRMENSSSRKRWVSRQ
jgi:hypothetical protein